jgi:hypothetical protein
MQEIISVLLSDDEWMIRHSTIQGIVNYAKFSIFDFRAIVPPAWIGEVIDCIKHSSQGKSSVVEYEQLVELQNSTLDNLLNRKRGVFPKANVPDSKRMKVSNLPPNSAEERVKQGVEMILQGFKFLEPIQAFLDDNQKQLVSSQLQVIQKYVNTLEADLQSSF